MFSLSYFWHMQPNSSSQIRMKSIGRNWWNINSTATKTKDFLFDLSCKLQVAFIYLRKFVELMKIWIIMIFVSSFISVAIWYWLTKLKRKKVQKNITKSTEYLFPYFGHLRSDLNRIWIGTSSIMKQHLNETENVQH